MNQKEYERQPSLNQWAMALFFLLILVGAGIATSIPLLFFAQGASRIPLSMIGFLQYIAPSISLLLGVFVFQ